MVRVPLPPEEAGSCCSALILIAAKTGSSSPSWEHGGSITLPSLQDKRPGNLVSVGVGAADEANPGQQGLKHTTPQLILRASWFLVGTEVPEVLKGEPLVVNHQAVSDGRGGWTEDFTLLLRGWGASTVRGRALNAPQSWWNSAVPRCAQGWSITAWTEKIDSGCVLAMLLGNPPPPKR